MNLQRQVKLEFYSGYGRVVKEVLNYTLLKYQPREISPKLYLYLIHPKPYLAPRKVFW